MFLLLFYVPTNRTSDVGDELRNNVIWIGREVEE